MGHVAVQEWQGSGRGKYVWKRAWSIQKASQKKATFAQSDMRQTRHRVEGAGKRQGSKGGTTRRPISCGRVRPGAIVTKC